MPCLNPPFFKERTKAAIIEMARKKFQHLATGEHKP